MPFSFIPVLGPISRATHKIQIKNKTQDRSTEKHLSQKLTKVIA